jgi:Tol biopolymer transport system component
MRHLSATMTAKTTLWMSVALAAAIVAAFLVVVLGTPTKRAEAAFPGNNGKIAFVSRVSHTDTEIVTMKANGDNKTALTNNGRFIRDEDPAFSANGRKIAFASNRSSRSGELDIYTMSANGTDKKRVTRSESPDLNPAWSPNGTRIAFDSTRHDNNDIYVINQDGTGLTRITTSQLHDSSPAWSPDGTRIAFVRGGAIYLMKPAPESATNRPQRLTTSGSAEDESDPSWSPDGTRLVFTDGQTGVLELYSIRADGSSQIRLTNSSGRDPAWSPDGTKIAFSAKRGSASTSGIYVMNAAPESATNRPKRLTGNATNNDAPDWQPLR